MTAALSAALEAYDSNWPALGLEQSYIKTVQGTVYAVLVDAVGLVGVFRVTTRRCRVYRVYEWPAEVASEFPRATSPPA